MSGKNPKTQLQCFSLAGITLSGNCDAASSDSAEWRFSAIVTMPDSIGEACRHDLSAEAPALSTAEIETDLKGLEGLTVGAA